jgi:hypothetical protein
LREPGVQGSLQVWAALPYVLAAAAPCGGASVVVSTGDRSSRLCPKGRRGDFPALVPGRRGQSTNITQLGATWLVIVLAIVVTVAGYRRRPQPLDPNSLERPEAGSASTQPVRGGDSAPGAVVAASFAASVIASDVIPDADASSSSMLLDIVPPLRRR